MSFISIDGMIDCVDRIYGLSMALNKVQLKQLNEDIDKAMSYGRRMKDKVNNIHQVYRLYVPYGVGNRKDNSFQLSHDLRIIKTLCEEILSSREILGEIKVLDEEKRNTLMRLSGSILNKVDIIPGENDEFYTQLFVKDKCTGTLYGTSLARNLLRRMNEFIELNVNMKNAANVLEDRILEYLYRPTGIMAKRMAENFNKLAAR